MAKLDKGTLALTFKFDCDRFLRFRLASDTERDALGISDKAYKRPGIELIQVAGKRWEAEKYQDLIDTSDAGKVVFRLEKEVNDLLGRRPFAKIEHLFDILRRPEPPHAIIEAEFTVPENITPGLQKAYDVFHLDRVKVRPDILWIRPGGTDSPLIGNETKPEYVIHVIDVKMAAEPSLRHFTEVTYYALALAEAIQQEGLSGRYGVSAVGTIWPGSNDINAFRNLVQHHKTRGERDPVSEALRETLVSVPYEIYQAHVKQFFEDRLLRVLQTKMEDASWHVGPKCQLCDYVGFCRAEADDCDHLSRVAWLNQGQAELLRSNRITTTAELAEAITKNDDKRWQSVIESSHQLRADGAALAARAQSLAVGVPVSIPGRRCAMMPAWSNQSIFITVHFDPGSGITFALGAARLYFPSGRKQGERPVTDEKIFIVDRMDVMNPETERERLKEFVGVVSEWLEEVSTANADLAAKEHLSSHIFFWDMLEVRQLKRMFERHMHHPDVINLIELLVRFFPPESVLPDPDAFKSQPGTIVKEVLRLLVGLPVAHAYTLFEVANSFFPNTRPDGSPYTFNLPFGFTTPMSDQIPFERAYELWKDKIFLRHFNEAHPTDLSKWKHYTRDELYDGLKRATREHLKALQHIVQQLRKNYGDLLVLKKSGFSAARSSQARVPEPARSLIAFEKLNVVCREIENRNTRSLPVDEREAKFFSIRGLTLKPQAEADPIIAEIKRVNPQYQGEKLYVFNFSPTSRDSRIKEGEFTVALSNENECVDLDQPWYRLLKLDFEAGAKRLAEYGLTDKWMVNKPIGALLQVEVIRLETTQERPYVVLKPNHQRLFEFAIAQKLVTLDSPLVLDPVYRDFTSTRIETALRSVGGEPARIKRARKRRKGNG